MTTVFFHARLSAMFAVPENGLRRFFMPTSGGLMAGMKKPTTKSGAPSAAARKATGGGKGMKPGSFPVSTAKQAADAIDLRGHAPNPASVLNKVGRSQFASNPTVKKKLADARAKDRKSK